MSLYKGLNQPWCTAPSHSFFPTEVFNSVIHRNTMFRVARQKIKFNLALTRARSSLHELTSSTVIPIIGGALAVSNTFQHWLSAVKGLGQFQHFGIWPSSISLCFFPNIFIYLCSFITFLNSQSILLRWRSLKAFNFLNTSTFHQLTPTSSSTASARVGNSWGDYPRLSFS